MARRLQADRSNVSSSFHRLASQAAAHAAKTHRHREKIKKLTKKVGSTGTGKHERMAALQSIMKQREQRLRAAGLSDGEQHATSAQDSPTRESATDDTDTVSTAFSVTASVPGLGTGALHIRSTSSGSRHSLDGQSLAAGSVPDNHPAAEPSPASAEALLSVDTSTPQPPPAANRRQHVRLLEPPSADSMHAPPPLPPSTPPMEVPGLDRGTSGTPAATMAEARRARALSRAGPRTGVGRVFTWGRVSALKQCDVFLAAGEIPAVCDSGSRKPSSAPLPRHARSRRSSSSAAHQVPSSPGAGGVPSPWARSQPAVYPAPLSGIPYLQTGITAGVGAPQLSPRHPLAIVQYAPTPRLSLRQVSTARGCALLLSDDGDLYEWAISDDQTSRISDTACAMHEASTWSLRVPRLVHSLTLHRAITGARVVAVACGPQHALALLDDGVVMSWGSADDGRLGHGALAAVESSGLPTVVSHNKLDAAGKTLKSSSFKPGCTSVYSSGVESSIQTPVLPPEPLGWQSLSRGASHSPNTRGSSRRHSVALAAASEASGRGPSATECMPRPIAGLAGKRVVCIGAGGAHSAAVTVEGEVWTWGRGRSGRLGHGDTKSQVLPKLVKGSGVVAGDSESSTGLLSWLGFGGKKTDAPDPDFVFDPLQFLPSPSDPHGCGSAGKWRGVRVLRVVCGRAFTVAITAQGEVWTWGSSSEGQCGVGLGQGPAADVTAPTLVSFPAPPGALAVTYTVPLAVGSGGGAAAMSTTASGRPSLLARHGLVDSHTRTASHSSGGPEGAGGPATPQRAPASQPLAIQRAHVTPVPSPRAVGRMGSGRQLGLSGALDDALGLRTPSPHRRGMLAAAAAASRSGTPHDLGGRGRSSSAPDVGSLVGSFMDSSFALSPTSAAMPSATTVLGQDAQDVQGGAGGETVQYLALLAAEGAAEREDSALDSPSAARAHKQQLHRHAVRSRRHRRTFAVAAAAGHGHTLVLVLDGRVFAWGDNRQGQVGAGSKPWFQSAGSQAADAARPPPAVQPVPIEVQLPPVLQYGAPEDGCDPWDRVTGVTCGEYHSMALSWRGRVFAWGSNASAELGVGHCEPTRRIIEVGTTIPRKFTPRTGKSVPVPAPSQRFGAEHQGTSLRRVNTAALETITAERDASSSAAEAEPASKASARSGSGSASTAASARKRTTLWVGVRLIAAGKDFSLIVEGSRAHLPPFSKRARRHRSSSDGLSGSSRSLLTLPSQGDAALQGIAGSIGITATQGSAASDAGQLPYALAMLSPVAAAQAMGGMDAGMAKLLRHSQPTRFGGTGRIRVNFGRVPAAPLGEHQLRYFAEERRLMLDTRRWMRSVGDFAAQRNGADLARMAAGGVHPTLRALVWPMSVGNALRITPETFAAACVRAQAVLQSVVAAAPHTGTSPGAAQAALQGSLQAAASTPAAGAPLLGSAWPQSMQHSRMGEAVHSASAASLAGLASEPFAGARSPDADSLPSIPSAVDLDALFAHQLPESVKVAVLDVVRQVAGHGQRPPTPLSSAVSPLVRPFGKESSVQLIDVDLKRVYPTQRLYAIDDAPGPLHRHLALVLYATSVTRPDLGYVQGMAYVAGMLVAHISDPYIAYQTLLNMVTKEHLYAFLTMDRTLMARFYQVFFFILRAVDGNTHKMFESRCKDLHPDLYLLPWFQTMFTKILPFPVCARLWDMYVVDGLAVLIKAAIVLLKGVAKQLGAAAMEDMLAVMTSCKHQVWVQVTQEEHFFKEMESIVITAQQRSWLLTLCDDAFFYRGSDLAQIFSRDISDK